MRLENIHNGEVVLVTGATGSLGRTIVRLLHRRGAVIRVFSRDEAKQEEMKAEWPKVEYVLGDVRDPRALLKAVKGVDTILHLASLKYVDRSEIEPTEYVLTNVLGTINLIAAVQAHPVSRVCGISTDKACSPFNTYGLTKGLLEKLFMEAHTPKGPRFTVARYGNVLASRGSVILKWQEARKVGGDILVTDPEMTRFFFTLEDAVELIDVALSVDGGAIISQAMPAATLRDLAEVMAEGSQCHVKVIGPRPGEKPDEDLLSIHEMSRVRKVADYFFYRPLGPIEKPPHLAPYTSATARRLTKDELKEMTAPWR